MSQTLLENEALTDLRRKRENIKNAFAFIQRNTEETSFVFGEDHQGLQYINISDNEKLTKVEFTVPLKNLVHLDISDSAVKEIVFPKGFKKLAWVDVSRNGLKKIKIEGELPVLEMLDLSSNQIKNWDIDVIPLLPKLKYLYLYNNPLNESVTAYHTEEDGSNNLRSIKELKAAFDKGERVKNEEYKVLVVGDGKSGKSCLVNRLVENEFEPEWDSTHGISVKQFKNKHQLFDFPYILNLWDFGGQDLYHNTHRLFMQTNTTYVLLWNQETEINDFTERKEKKKIRKWENRKLKYWLRYIAHIGGKTSVLVAQTISPPDNPQPKHPEQKVYHDLYEAYFSSFDFLDIDSKLENTKENGYRKLLRRMEDAIDDLNREEWLPKHWVDIRKSLVEMTPSNTSESANEFLDKSDKTLDFEEYITLAKEMGEDHPEKLLENWLVRTGVVFYKKGLFKNKIILDQEWVIKAIYTLYDREGYFHDIKDNKGRFNGALLNEIWDEYSQSEKELFLSFMSSCEMCFEISQNDYNGNTPFEEREFVAIEMLESTRTDGFKIQEANWKKEDLIYLRYKHSFFFYGIIQSFIARSYFFAEISNIYKKGVLINVDDVFVIIESHENKEDMSGEVLITLPKNGIKTLFRIQKEFENIHNRAIETSVSLDKEIFVNLNKLTENQEEEQIVSDCESIVQVDDYRLFIQYQQEKVESLSEELERKKKNILEERDIVSKGNQNFMDGIFSLLDDSKYKEVFIEIEKICPNYDFRTRLTDIKQDYKELDIEIRRGTIDRELGKVERKKINLSIYQLISDIKESGEATELNINSENLKAGIDSLHLDIGKLQGLISDGFSDVKNQLSQLDRNLIENLNISREGKDETLKLFQKLSENQISEAVMLEKIQETQQFMKSNLSKMPDEIIDLWKSLSDKAADEVDAKGKFKVMIPILPGIFSYQKEFAWDLKKVAKEIYRKGIVF